MGKTGKLLIVTVVVLATLAITFVGGLAFSKRTSMNFPLLDPSVENPNLSQTLIDFDTLRQDVKSYLAKLDVEHSFYFEYLANGVSIRDGDDQEAVGASLLKTPLVMDLYKLAEAGKVDLESTVRVTSADISSDTVYGDPSGLEVGDTVSLRNAAKIALQKSDNTAIALVRRTVQPLVDNDTDVFQSLDITYTIGDNPGTNGTNLSDNTVYISARSYASVLKCLYYACFLSAEDSEEILNNLIGSAGQARLPSGVPSTVKVAHKIGSSLKGDSDCGIFYAPKQPYLVCLILRGDNTSKANDTDQYFQRISKMVYSYVTSKN